jgi:adenine deaminase
MTVRFAPDIAAMRRLVAVARRSQPADLVVTSGALLDVYTEEILEGWGLVIAEGRVAYAGPDVEKFESVARIEGRGHIIVPGLVEAHTHLYRMGLAATVPLQLAAGVTTTVFETMELAYILGPAGVRELLADAAGMPGRVLFTVPTLTGLDPVFDRDLGIPGREWVDLLDLPGIVGVGEANWVEVIRGLGLKGGACAASAAWDSPCLIVVGDSAPDMAIALRRLKELQGGAVVASHGRVQAEFRAELAGVLSLAPAGEVVSRVTAVNGALQALGCVWPNSLLSIETLTTGVIPHLRLWAEGYVRLRDGARLGLNWG